jgi:hypothetical protein
LTKPDVVVEVAEEKQEKKYAPEPETIKSIVPAEVADLKSPNSHRSADLPLRVVPFERKMSFTGTSGHAFNEDKMSRVSERSRASRNSKTSKTSRMTADSKKYIQTCSWMFRDDDAAFAIRLEGANSAKTPITLNLSEFAEGRPVGGPLQETADDDKAESTRSRGPVAVPSEASMSIVAGSETTGSRTAASTVITNLMTNQGLKDLFNMIWSARGLRKKYSRECPF